MSVAVGVVVGVVVVVGVGVVVGVVVGVAVVVAVGVGVGVGVGVAVGVGVGVGVVVVVGVALSMHVNLLNIEQTLLRIEKLLQPATRTPRKPKVELTDTQWLAKLVEMYPTLDVPEVLREEEAYRVSVGQVMTRVLGQRKLAREAARNKPATVPGAGKKHGGLVL